MIHKRMYDLYYLQHTRLRHRERERELHESRRTDVNLRGFVGLLFRILAVWIYNCDLQRKRTLHECDY
jgi:hypothetical protein